MSDREESRTNGLLGPSITAAILVAFTSGIILWMVTGISEKIDRVNERVIGMEARVSAMQTQLGAIQTQLATMQREKAPSNSN